MAKASVISDCQAAQDAPGRAGPQAQTGGTTAAIAPAQSDEGAAARFNLADMPMAADNRDWG